MVWQDFSKLKNTHAFCAASKAAWRNYTIEKLLQTKANSYAADIGTALHEYACGNIEKKFKMNKTDKHSVLRYLVVDRGFPSTAIDIDRLFPNLMTYVNDCIGFRMDPEVVLYYSHNFYGTTDAIFWDGVTLRISDLKTGAPPKSFTQLENYAAFFCLNYNVKPESIKKMEFRLYQNDGIAYAEPDPLALVPVIEQITMFDRALSMEFGKR